MRDAWATGGERRHCRWTGFSIRHHPCRCVPAADPPHGGTNEAGALMAVHDAGGGAWPAPLVGHGAADRCDLNEVPAPVRTGFRAHPDRETRGPLPPGLRPPIRGALAFSGFVLCQPIPPHPVQHPVGCHDFRCPADHAGLVGRSGFRVSPTITAACCRAVNRNYTGAVRLDAATAREST